MRQQQTKPNGICSWRGWSEQDEYEMKAIFQHPIRRKSAQWWRNVYYRCLVVDNVIAMSSLHVTIYCVLPLYPCVMKTLNLQCTRNKISYSWINRKYCIRCADGKSITTHRKSPTIKLFHSTELFLLFTKKNHFLVIGFVNRQRMPHPAASDSHFVIIQQRCSL